MFINIQFKRITYNHRTLQMEFVIVLLVYSQTNGRRYPMPMEISWKLSMPEVHWIDTTNANCDWIKKKHRKRTELLLRLWLLLFSFFCILRTGRWMLQSFLFVFRRRKKQDSIAKQFLIEKPTKKSISFE